MTIEWEPVEDAAFDWDASAWIVGRLFKLDENRQVVPVTGLKDWAMSQASEGRIVGRDEMGDMLVSTVFLGMSQNYGFEGPPLVFETIIFQGGRVADITRAATWDEAKRNHEFAVVGLSQ